MKGTINHQGFGECRSDSWAWVLGVWLFCQDRGMIRLTVGSGTAKDARSLVWMKE
jgi:hypothetical protein